MKVWQEEIRVNCTSDELCQLMEDLISRHEREIFGIQRTEGGGVYATFRDPRGFVPHDPTYDPTQHAASGMSIFSRGGQSILRVQPDDYGVWAELYQAMQRYGFLDEQPAETSTDSEPCGPAVNNISGGVNVDANNVTVGNDVIGRDKITQMINIEHASIIQRAGEE